MAEILDYSLLAAITANRLSSGLLAAGLLALFALLTVLVWTRFGQARPISKCVVLSLLAHLLLLIYMYSSHVLYGPPGLGKTMRPGELSRRGRRHGRSRAGDIPRITRQVTRQVTK